MNIIEIAEEYAKGNLRRDQTVYVTSYYYHDYGNSAATENLKPTKGVISNIRPTSHRDGTVLLSITLYSSRDRLIGEKYLRFYEDPKKNRVMRGTPKVELYNTLPEAWGGYAQMCQEIVDGLEEYLSLRVREIHAKIARIENEARKARGKS